MRYLHKIFHEINTADFQKLYNERFTFESTCKIPLNIKPMNQPNLYQLYYIPTNNIIRKVSSAHKISKQLEGIFKKLPAVAKDQFVMECLVEELFNTNELEGVKSSKEEIARSAREIKLNKKNKARFNSMIKSYLNLTRGERKIPHNAQDIRSIYDDITKGEIEEAELPDGEIFRKEKTYVLKKSGTGKVIHQGVIPEKTIISTIEDLIEFLNNSQDVPELIKIAIGHYYFGYIHPFYDGNGRTSRFISSLYLSTVLGRVSAFSISRGCNKYRNKYLEVFEVTNSLKGRGELNYFIDTFLDIIIETLEDMTTEIKEKAELLKIATDKIKNEPLLKGISENHKLLMFVIAQNHFFDSTKGITVKELADVFKCTDVTIRKRANDLIDLSLLEKIGERPVQYTIKEGYFES